MSFRVRILALAVLLGLTLPVLGQAGPPADRDALVELVKQRAARDIELGQAPQRIGELRELFGRDADRLGVSSNELLEIYEERYRQAKREAPLPPWWRSFKPNAGWWVAALFLVLLIFRDVLKDGLSKLLTALRDHIYGKLAGSRLFRRAAIRRYRRAVVKKYRRLTIPFRPDRPLEMREVFVPLKVQGARDTDLIDAQRAVDRHRWLMVTGAPGSGKSMLARQLAMSLSERGLADPLGQPVPVLLELNRLNDSSRSLKEQLVQMFRLNEFPRAERFVTQALEQGALVMLFDGLDEVITDLRSSVVAQIRDLLDTYEQCRALITCRTAVYRQEFTGVAERTLEIVEFSDHQIWRFLGAWEQDMPAGKSVEQLLQTLRDRPRIMALARNPLLLTIIAYLYTDTRFVLPHSRTEFYERSTDLLLEQWKHEQNQYKSTQKRLVLQHLALFNQKRGTHQREDRRSIDLKTVLAEVKAVLPQLNLRDGDAQPLLDEIVERSGLLHAINGGARYQFAHLTLQEFFTAAELRTESAKLIDDYRADPAAWRETVKLWCGLGTDSTEVVRAVFEIDPVTAFECLADAQKIEPEDAVEIVGHFRERLAEEGETGDAIRRAFAAVAADLRPRGQEVFGFLVNALEDASSPKLQGPAADALSLTNLPRAAQVLARHYGELDQARPALVRMGDLAVRDLVALAERGSIEAVDDLRVVGTPQAASALVPLLWAEGQDLAVRTAWRLGALLGSEAVESALRELDLTEQQKSDEWLDWVWAPFSGPEASALPIIAGRIGNLVLAEPADAPMVEVLDPRLSLALCVASVESGVDLEPLWNWGKESTPREEIRNLYGILGLMGMREKSSVERSKAIKDELLLLEESEFLPLPGFAFKDLEWLTKALNVRGRLRRFIGMLKPAVGLKLLLKTIRGPVPTVEDWREVFKPSSFKFGRSWSFIVIGLLYLAITCVALYGVWSGNDSLWIRLSATLILVLNCYITIRLGAQEEPEGWEGILLLFFGPLGVLIALPSVISNIGIRGVGEKIGFAIVAGPIMGGMFCWLPVALYYAFGYLETYSSYYLAVSFWLVFPVASSILWIHAMRLQRRSLNVLHGILNPPLRPTAVGGLRGVGLPFLASRR